MYADNPRLQYRSDNYIKLPEGDEFEDAYSTDNIPQPETTPSGQVTNLPDEYEDIYRKSIYDIFDLQPLQLLLLQAMLHHKTLTEFANELNAIVSDIYNRKDKMTRFSAYYLKKTIAAKYPAFVSTLAMPRMKMKQGYEAGFRKQYRDSLKKKDKSK